eukprot:TRINITY_DN29427_c0_g1_i1.p1 TRINITY_DN29427_c0_g1~~TRINITY_DN29427_c0_g1_i1.p1  ORF type:complete len:657 (-),score=180.27 TRINITY_DN29427_c0_g1_i1:39-1961(-)
MDFFAVTRKGVNVYSFQPGEAPPQEPAFSFPAVSTAEGCEWGADGNLLGLVEPNTGGVSVYNAAKGYEKICEVPPLVGGPVRNFYFSPAGNHLVTHERWVKDAGNNVGVWDVATGELNFSFTLKKMTEMTWPPLKWTSTESHCCRMVQDGVQIMPGSLDKEREMTKLDAAGIMAFEVAPRGSGTGGTGSPHVAIVIAESKGQPARCQVFKLDDCKVATAAKNFFKAQTVTMKWNNTGTALLVKTSMEVDDTGKSYYGGSNLYFIRADGEESALVANADGGAIHDVQWNPTQDEFVLLHGQLPCPATLHEGRKGNKRMDFGTGHRNTIKWNNFGRFFVLGGYGQLLGDTDFWDKPGKKLMGSTRMECCVVCGWAPDGRHFITATTAPRMRVDNKIEIYDYVGSNLGKLQFADADLLLAGWRPRPRGAYQDRPPSPDRKKVETSQAGAKAAPKAAGAYRPPGARGGGGFAAQLRQELGSTAAQSTTTATKVGAPGPVNIPGALPPGVSPEQFMKGQQGQSQGGGGGASRNARKKKAKEKAQGEGDEEKPAAADAASSATFTPPARADSGAAATKAAQQAPAPAEGDAADTDKKIRALKKKLREIEQIKEKEAGGQELNDSQKQKISGEAEILRQLRELGAEL